MIKIVMMMMMIKITDKYEGSKDSEIVSSKI
jgi:hypothetical protein